MKAKRNVELNNLTDRIHVFNEKATSLSFRGLISRNWLKRYFLKMDCDGWEYEHVENIGDRTFEKITHIVMEY